MHTRWTAVAEGPVAEHFEERVFADIVETGVFAPGAERISGCWRGNDGSI